MPHNTFNLPPSAIWSPAPEIFDVFFPEGTLLVDKDGNSYRAAEIRSSEIDGDTDARQYIRVQSVEGENTLIRELSIDQIADLDIRVVWFPEEAAK